MSTPEALAALRDPFPASAIGSIPKGGIQIDFVGHAAVTDRLLSVDPSWTWEPVAFDESNLPAIRQSGQMSSLWIKLTVCGVTRYGVGIKETKKNDLEKQLIGDAIRNAAMRFGVALDLWTKGDLESEIEGGGGREDARETTENAERESAAAPAPASPPSSVPGNTDELLESLPNLPGMELNALLKQYRLDLGGTKEEMRNRIREHLLGEPF